jgi:hypothetical protein
MRPHFTLLADHPTVAAGYDVGLTILSSPAVMSCVRSMGPHGLTPWWESWDSQGFPGLPSVGRWGFCIQANGYTLDNVYRPTVL